MPAKSIDLEPKGLSEVERGLRFRCLMETALWCSKRPGTRPEQYKPPPLARHPRLDLCGFRVLSNSWFLHLSIPGGCKVWAGSGSKLVVFLRWSLPGGLQALNQLDLSGANGCKVWKPNFLQMESQLDASSPERVDYGFGLQSCLVCRLWRVRPARRPHQAHSL